MTIAHPLEWTQHFHPALNANNNSRNQNFVQLPGPGFEGIQEAGLELQQADEELLFGLHSHAFLGDRSPLQIADNAVRTLRDREYL